MLGDNAALGFSDHSGWAVMAIVRRTDVGDFELVARSRIETCPASLPRQPFHAVAEDGAPRALIAEVADSARDLALRAIWAATGDGHSVVTASVAIGRSPIPDNLERILRSHSLLHAAEGELYRTAIAEAADSAGLRVVRFQNHEARSEAAAALGCSLEQLEEDLARIGKLAGKPWTKDEKDATAAAILALAVTQSSP
jgi:hypothetical protein